MSRHLRTEDLGLFDRAGFRTAEDGLEFLGDVVESITEHSVIATDREAGL